MKGLLTLTSLVFGALIVLVVPTFVEPFASDYGGVTIFDTGKAVLLCALLAAVAGYFSYHSDSNGPFLLKLFVGALLVRLLIGTTIFVFHWQEFFGGDANTYDIIGLAQLNAWYGDKYAQVAVNNFVGGGSGSGWGMVYLVAVIYGLIGRNLLATQLINSVLGAATAVVIFLCAKHVFNNLRVARVAAFAVAFTPPWCCGLRRDLRMVQSFSYWRFPSLRLSDWVRSSA